jgi:hypothetical protein
MVPPAFNTRVLRASRQLRRPPPPIIKAGQSREGNHGGRKMSALARTWDFWQDALFSTG